METMNTLLHAFVEWPLWLSVTIVVLLSALVPCFLVKRVRLNWPHPAFKENNELVGFTYAVYGLIYGVLLAFTIIVGWERFASTEQLVMHETTLLSELWHDSQSFSPAVRDPIHKTLVEYAQSVVDDEWPAMSERGQYHVKTRDIYSRLWTLSYTIEPETKNQEAYLGEFLARMNELSCTRRERILYSRMEVHSILWMVLLIGALPTIAYPLLFSNKHPWVQMVITGSIMLIVMLGLLVIVSLERPFSGSVSIKPEPLQELLEIYHQRLAEPAPNP